jgi:hypothetical protein
MKAKSIAIWILSVGILSSCSRHRITSVSSVDGLKSISADSWRKSQKAIQTCVQKAGFKYIAEPLTNFFQSPNYLDIPYSEQEALVRKKIGYGIADQQRESIKYSTISPNAIYANTLSSVDREKFFLLVHGSPAHPSAKCASPIRSDQEERTIMKKAAAATSRFAADPLVQRVNASWADCMRKQGFASATHMWNVKKEVVFEAVNVFQDSNSGSFEVRVGKADIFCLQNNIRPLNDIRESIENKVLR